MASTSENSEHIQETDFEDEVQIPNGLKFMLDAMKILAQNPLTADNHLIWSSQVEIIFSANGYQKYLDPTFPKPATKITNIDGTTRTNPLYKKWNLINKNLIASLIATISPSIQPFVLRQETVADLWNALKMKLQSTTKSRIIQLKEELHSLHMKGNSMTEYLTSVKGILDQLEAAGSHIEDEDIMIYIMNGLPALYNGFKTAIRIKSDKTDLNTFYSLLISEEINLQRQNKVETISNTMALNINKERTSFGQEREDVAA